MAAATTVEQRVELFSVNEAECIAVGSDGQLWHLGAGASSLITLDEERAVRKGQLPESTASGVLTQLRNQVKPTALPRVSPGDVFALSADAVLTHAIAVDNAEPDVASRGLVFRFAGHWHRLLLAAGGAESTAQLALNCLAATIADPATARALRAPAVQGRQQSPSVDESCPPPELQVLERWSDGGWHGHALEPAPIVDPVTGILHRVARRANLSPLPAAFVHLHAELPHAQSIKATFTPDALAPAGALDDGKRTAADLLEPGLLSGVAHYCGADLDQGTRIRASAAELHRDGERLCDLAAWQPHDPALHKQPGCPFVEVTTDTRIEWLRGRDGWGAIWVPHSLVFGDYLRGHRDSALPTNANNLVGLHAGRSWSEAVERAAAHVLAHDAVAVWWSSTNQADSVQLPRRATAVLAGSTLALHILAIPSVSGAPVRLAVLDDVQSNIVSLGFAAHANDETAAELATVEALIQHSSAHDLASERSLIRSSAALGNGEVAGLAPWHPQRHYAHAFGTTHQGLIDPMAHVQYGLDPDVVELTRQRTRPAGATVQHAHHAEPPSITSRATAQLITVDVTTERVREAGFRAVRAIVPGLARLQPAAFPLDPRARLTSARRALGWHNDTSSGPYPGW